MIIVLLVIIGILLFVILRSSRVYESNTNYLKASIETYVQDDKKTSEWIKGQEAQWAAKSREADILVVKNKELQDQVAALTDIKVQYEKTLLEAPKKRKRNPKA